ncbi:MAG: carbohydrate ABC transporter permease [Lachnospiraceae bacterium]|nr:carbohydrate ABC transporter permease [Lachnospiraceae bacterium]MCI6409499.1 carbohydrate ABC transporter permease [Lachnospiraceae bacterium]MCI6665258.1 carbohydrate ABC transporter permease [Lachnospiraceae bacterium]MCI6978583.1 carbohydrate ABC transporter permease [Lachnospiraceae bacterium]MDD6580788.1 carbohydrate ABC transporter permease [Lachnospiraceae bacterium]
MSKNKDVTISATSTKSKVVQVIIYVFLTLLAVIYIAPLLWVVITSLKDDSTLMLSPWAMPDKLMFENYTFAWTAGNLGRATLNSFIVCTITLILSMLFGAMAAYAIAILRWKLAKLTLTYFLIGMMVPVHCVLIPLFIQFSKLKMSNSLIGIIIPYITFSLPITIYILVGFFEGIPRELFESACIDGCSVYKMFGTVALPLAKTGFMVTGLMSFVNNWNELLLAMVFISNEAKKTLPVSLTKFVGPYNTNYCQMFAAIVLAIIPTIIVYCMFSNQIVDGLTQGAVKG